MSLIVIVLAVIAIVLAVVSLWLPAHAYRLLAVGVICAGAAILLS